MKTDNLMKQNLDNASVLTDKRVILLGLLAIMSFQLIAQEKTHNVSLGFGFPNFPRFFFNQFDSKNRFESSGSGPFHLKYEYRLNRWVGLGTSVNYIQYKITWVDDVFDTLLGRMKPNNISIENRSVAVNSRVNVHLINPENHPEYDIYWGFGIGYQFGGGVRVRSDFPEYALNIKLPRISRLGLESSIGFRRQIWGEKLKIYSEIGLTKSLMQLGLNYQF
jgi:hypothetical protein